MNIDELKGAELDFWVAKARGFEAEVRSMYGQSYCRIDVHGGGYQIYEPTSNVLLAGAIAFERHYTVFPRRDACAGGVPPVWIWLAEAQQNPNFHGLFCDASPNVAICRLCVAEAIAEKRLVDITELPRPAAAAPRDFDSRGVAAMSDMQAEQSLLRWKARHEQHLL
ncbi:DUF2591 domain-containing protein [Paraburkholderia sp. Ac-20342]|uniref:DUF2591 family protein n=1 Tax=Paraburkholderia sp. Ac-20342 TaxID=2703889 RepID=UPI00198121B0|nr:DUF2591 family protein [Paraburkholderia sp. Ac-20342]MBN3848161.1 DUF2591 domain-containing protein [Paraburkholderia sp. Ac-20342]